MSEDLDLAIWNACAGPVVRVYRNGEWVDRAEIRQTSNGYWLYRDSVVGYVIVTDEEMEAFEGEQYQ